MKGRKTLILGLEEVLVHMSLEDAGTHDLMIPIKQNDIILGTVNLYAEFT